MLRYRTLRMAFSFQLVLVSALLGGCGDDTASGSGAGGGTAATSGSGGAGGGTTATSGSGGAGGTSGGSGGGGGDCGDLAALSDTFDGAGLDPCWTIFNPEVADVSVGAGVLSLRVVQASLWFNESRGALVYKLVSGDFKATARVHARKTSNAAEPPSNSVHLGGLMARDPAGDAAGGVENYVFIVLGEDENDRSVETKNTVDSASTYVGPTWPSGDAELRVCRVGAAFHLYKRDIGAPAWTLATTYDRPDLPATLQVGANAYTLSAPDLTVSYDEIVFSPVQGDADCTTD